MALKDRNRFPPGSFIFYEAKTNWTSPAHIGFNDTVEAIRQHRLANPGRFDWATDSDSIAAELDSFTESRLRQTYGSKADSYLMGAPATAQSFPWPILRQRKGVGENAAGAKTKSGVGTILSWLGDGLRPTDQATTTKRAETCSVCPLNVHLEGLAKAVGTVGEFLHMVMSAKSDLKLSTPFDDKLFQCSACLCHIPVKIWVPAEHIRKGMTPEVKAALDPRCWQLPLLK